MDQIKFSHVFMEINDLLDLVFELLHSGEFADTELKETNLKEEFFTNVLDQKLV